ncbi:ATP-binding protein [Colwellia asteriadis]|uniref:histidine kinase n=1 Tax=Colwellia asteriadis TaxID=517723 RepID=A0ABN1L5T8_9GAMM
MTHVTAQTIKLDPKNSSNLDAKANASFGAAFESELNNDVAGLHSTLNHKGVNFVARKAKAPTRHVSLAQESFPGELASLRAQLAEQTSPQFNQNITQKNQLADQLIDVMPTGLVMLDGNGIVVRINKVASHLLDEPILGQPWFEVIARSFNPREDDWHEISLKDGRRVKLEISSLGAQPGQLIMITDLTQTRLLQDKIGQMQRLSSLGRMVSTLAHQIRTPLSAAILYGANLKNSQLPEASRLSFQEKLNARLYDLEQQVNDMLLFSKSGTEQVVAPVVVNDLINSSVQSMDALLTKAKAQVNLQLSTEEHTILGNKSALTGAIQNLLHNALKAAVLTQQTVINIQVYSQENNIYLSVKDNGPGIDVPNKDKIFEPFYTSSSQGTGLGLAVVKSVVNAHQGDVKLISKAGEGAHFVIRLPLMLTTQTKSNTSPEHHVGEH